MGRQRQETERENGQTAETEIIYGRNAVLEALRADKPINKILMAEESGGSLRVIAAAAREKRVLLQNADKHLLTQQAGTDKHQGVMAYLAAGAYCTPEDILQIAQARGEAPFVILLDEIQDPHNLGAIIRTADAVGAHGIMIPKRRSAPLTGVVAKASAGAAAHVPVARVPNLSQAIETLKAHGLWIAGTDMDGDSVFYQADLRGPMGLVIGGEGKGIGTLVRRHCDFILSIPMGGRISSLNASVAAGIVLYEIYRQRLS